MGSRRTILDGSPDASPLVNGLRVLRQRWWIIVGTTVVVTVVLLGVALSATKQYEATSSLLIRSSDLTSLIDPSAEQNADPARDAATNLLLVKSSAVASRVQKQIGGKTTADDLLGKIDPTAEPDANLIDIAATDPDPARAARIADAFAEQFVSFRRASDQQRADDGAQLLRRQIAALGAHQSSQRAQLEQALQKTIVLKTLAAGNAEVVDKAEIPTTAASPLPKRSALVGVLLGLALGVALVFLVDLLDRRVKTVEDFEGLYRFRALATIPRARDDRLTQRDREVALEAFRILLHGLGFLSATGGEVRVVLVTSAATGEGKSSVAAGLARAVSLAGQSVVLVEIDLRRPSVHKQFDPAEDGRGLASALVERIPVKQLLWPAPPELETLRVLSSGLMPPNSAELLNSVEMSRVLQELKIEAKIVILDAPPLLPATDAHVLLDNPYVDAGLVVVRANVSTRDEIRRTRAVLDRHQLHDYGLVVNDIDETDGGNEHYGAANPRPDSSGSG